MRYGPAHDGPVHSLVVEMFETATYARPPSTVTDEFTPPLGTLNFQTSRPSSALRAKTQPRLDATNTQPSATTGVPVKSPSPPARDEEKVQAGASVAASRGPMACSASWKRVFARSWP